MKEIQYSLNLPTPEKAPLESMNPEVIQSIIAFHQSFPQYEPTPLLELPQMATSLKLAKLCIKDESWRFGLNAFKVLGGSYAMAKTISQAIGRPMKDTDYQYLTSDELLRDFGQVTFYTATDGNHGRGVAWAAHQLRQKAVVHMPWGTTQKRLEHIQKEGATVTIEPLNYDECVALAAREAKAQGGILLQDTAWPGYEEIPTWIMQGYGTMAREADLQWQGPPPTHLFLQAGVGSMAGAVAGYFANRYPDHFPTIVIVEPEAANCLYLSNECGDGLPHVVDGSMETIMAGLACGAPNSISWEILRHLTRAFLSCQDSVAARGMRMLAAPLKGDPPIISGESGAVPFGALATILGEEGDQELCRQLQLNESSRVLIFSTEGDTDPGRFRSILWEGNPK